MNRPAMREFTKIGVAAIPELAVGGGENTPDFGAVNLQRFGLPAFAPGAVKKKRAAAGRGDDFAWRHRGKVAPDAQREFVQRQRRSYGGEGAVVAQKVDSCGRADPEGSVRIDVKVLDDARIQPVACSIISKLRAVIA